MAYCGNCGKPALEGDSFCYYCGAALQKAPTTNDAVQQAAAAPLAEETKDEPLPVIEAEPVTEEPIAEEPVSEETAVVESAAEEPAAKESAAEEPAADETAVEEPIIEEPTVEESIAEEPITEESITEEPIAQEPTEEPMPVIEQPAVMEEPLTVIEQPAAAPVVAVIPQPIPTAAVTEEPAKAQKPAKRKDLLTAFQYIALTLLFHVPVVGLVFLFVWGCGGTSNISLKRFSLAMLILRLIGLILLTLCALCTLLSFRWGFGDAIMEGLRQLYEALRPIFG